MSNGQPPETQKSLPGPKLGYQAAQWRNLRRWLDDSPDDELATEIRAELTTDPARYTRYQRERLGWGVFALMGR